MAADISDFAKARLRALQAQQMRQPPDLDAATSFAAAAQPPDNTSTGAGEFTAPAAKPKDNWRARVGAALQGAAYSMQANVPTVPGQEFRAALLRGIAGTAGAYSASERARAAREARDQGFTERMAMLDAKQAGRETPEQAAEKARLIEEAKYPTRSKLQREAAARTEDRMMALKRVAVGSATSDDDRRDRARAWDMAMNRAKTEYTTDDATLSRYAEEIYAWIKKEKPPADTFKYLQPPK